MTPEQFNGVVGLLLLVLPLVLTLPGKAADADQLNANLKSIYTQALVDDAKGDNYETLKPVGLAQLILILMVSGRLVAALGTVSVVTGRKE